MLLLVVLFLVLTFIECNKLNVNRLPGGSSNSIDSIVNSNKNSTINKVINDKIDVNTKCKSNVNLTLSAMTWNLAEKKIKVNFNKISMLPI